MSMSSEELEAFLAEPRLCHFATVDSNDRPRVRPMWFLWRDGVLWFTTRLESRHTGRDLANGGRVAVSIASDERPYRGVVVHGTVEVVGRDGGLLRAISTRYGKRQGEAWVREAMTEPDRTVLRLEPETLISWDYGTDV